ncbi:MAG: inositol monophosphatase [Schleiferiaceae bacterium]|nr:inositol monophosphatase [Schleiferiaceae bacterium]
MENLNLKQLTNQAGRIAIAAGKWMRKQQQTFDKNAIETKSFNSLVSYVDKGAEEYIVKHLLQLTPNAEILGEESGLATTDSDLRWIIDPLDGTTNFIHGLPTYAVSIALECKGELVLGVIYEVGLDECFSAYKNGGAFLNGQPIRVSDTADLGDSLIATGFPYSDFKKMPAYMDIFKSYMQHSHGLRRLGTAATDLAYVACGRFEGFFEYGLAPWDVAAGIVIVREAGGIVTDFNKGDNCLYGMEIAAASAVIFDDFYQPIENHWNS